MQNLPTVAIVGRPNVGKSTLFNRILGIRQAITSREPGTTRDRVAEEVEWNDKKFLLVDTAGFLVDYFDLKEKEIESKAQEQIKYAAEEADLILFVADVKDGVLPADVEVARLLRRFNKKVILALNKADTLKSEQSGEFDKLGFSEQVCVSAITGRRTGQLLDLVVRHLPKATVTYEQNFTKIAIVGRPNVGKSTLFNALIGSERSIVSEVPGTTRDSIKFKTALDGKSKPFEIIDTAGFRRRGKIESGIEKFSAFRVIKSIAQADLVLVVADASEGFTRQDAHIVQLALDKKKRVIVVINKLDLLKDKTTDEVKNFYRYPFINRIPSVAISAKNKDNLKLLLKEIGE